MKCVDLIATQYTVLFECGGHQMQKGDIVLVDEKVADRMVLQYKMKKGDSHELGKLQHGHWQVRRMTKEAKGEAVVALKDGDKVVESTEGVATDKSMGTSSGEVKKVTKKKATKKKTAKKA